MLRKILPLKIIWNTIVCSRILIVHDWLWSKHAYPKVNIHTSAYHALRHLKSLYTVVKLAVIKNFVSLSLVSYYVYIFYFLFQNVELTSHLIIKISPTQTWVLLRQIITYFHMREPTGCGYASLWCGSGLYGTFHFDAAPDPDLAAHQRDANVQPLA